MERDLLQLKVFLRRLQALELMMLNVRLKSVKAMFREVSSKFIFLFKSFNWRTQIF